MVIVVALGGGEEREVIAAVVDTGDKDDNDVPQQTNTHMRP